MQISGSKYSTVGRGRDSMRSVSRLKTYLYRITYKEIADRLFVSPRTVDGYRDVLLEKLNCKSRIGLVMLQ